MYRAKCQIYIVGFASGYLASEYHTSEYHASEYLAPEYLASGYLASGASKGTFHCGREKVLRRSGLALGLHSVRHYWD